MLRKTFGIFLVSGILIFGFALEGLVYGFIYQGLGFSVLNINFAYAGCDFLKEPLSQNQWCLNNSGDFFFDYQQLSLSEAKQAVLGTDINIEGALNNYSAKREVVIALIDTGVDINHDDLNQNIWVNSKEIPANGLDDDQNGYIDDIYGWNFCNNTNQIYTMGEDFHGTHCAGSMIACSDNNVGISGICDNPKIKLIVLKVLSGSQSCGKTSSIIEAIKYAESMGASICNLSAGIFENDLNLYETIKSSKMLFVVAAGNGGNGVLKGKDLDVSPIYPTGYNLENIITVANLQPDGQLNYSSNYGDVAVDLAAPGTSIISTCPNNQYSYMSGTSMAAPLVSATAALLYAGDNKLSLKDVKEIILASTTKLYSLKGLVATEGMLNLKGAMDYNYTVFGQSWSVGQAPEIAFKVIKENGKQSIVISVNDADNDLVGLYYMEGFCVVKDFKKGTLVKDFALCDNHKGTLALDENKGGTYTFYAFDKLGNEDLVRVAVFPN